LIEIHVVGKAMSTDLAKLFQLSYTHFVLRDFFGKIIPGLIFLYSVAVVLMAASGTCGAENNCAGIVVIAFNDASTVTIILVFGLAWIAAFAVQGLWEIIVRLSCLKETSACIGLRYAELRKLESYSWHQFEFKRLVVIEEACRNGALSILLSEAALVVAAAFCKPTWLGMLGLESVSGAWLAVILFGLIAVSLLWMGYLHLSRQVDFLNNALAAERAKTESSKDSNRSGADQ
jgi:hypothetical protein